MPLAFSNWRDAPQETTSSTLGLHVSHQRAVDTRITDWIFMCRVLVFDRLAALFVLISALFSLRIFLHTEYNHESQTKHHTNLRIAIGYTGSSDRSTWKRPLEILFSRSLKSAALHFKFLLVPMSACRTFSTASGIHRGVGHIASSVTRARQSKLPGVQSLSVVARASAIFSRRASSRSKRLSSSSLARLSGVQGTDRPVSIWRCEP